MSVFLLSSSEIKKNAVAAVFPLHKVILHPVDVEFNPEQPVEPFGIVCAKMRFQEATPILQKIWNGNDIVVAIESSILVENGHAYDIVNVVIYHVSNKYFIGASGGKLEFDKYSFDKAQAQAKETSIAGFSLTIGEYLKKNKGWDSKNWHTNYGIDRTDQIIRVLKEAYAKSEPTREDVFAAIRYVPEFPKAGVLFQDSSALFEHPALKTVLVKILRQLINKHQLQNTTHVCGVESRGFTFGVMLSMLLPSASFVHIRKAGKLPPPVIAEEYGTEYSTDTIEISATANFMSVKKPRVLIVDDLVATGGSLLASATLVKKVCPKAQVSCFALLQVLDSEMMAQTRAKFQEKEIKLMTI